MSKFAQLSQLAGRAQKLADQCDLHASTGEPNNPWQTIGGLRQLTSELVNQIEFQIAQEDQERFEREQYQTEMRRLKDARRDRREQEYGVRATGEI
jgi:hypothetical protein